MNFLRLHVLQYLTCVTLKPSSCFWRYNFDWIIHNVRSEARLTHFSLHHFRLNFILPFVTQEQKLVQGFLFLLEAKTVKMGSNLILVSIWRIQHVPWSMRENLFLGVVFLSALASFSFFFSAYKLWVIACLGDHCWKIVVGIACLLQVNLFFGKLSGS